MKNIDICNIFRLNTKIINNRILRAVAFGLYDTMHHEIINKIPPAVTYTMILLVILVLTYQNCGMMKYKTTT